MLSVVPLLGPGLSPGTAGCASCRLTVPMPGYTVIKPGSCCLTCPVLPSRMRLVWHYDQYCQVSLPWSRPECRHCRTPALQLTVLTPSQRAMQLLPELQSALPSEVQSSAESRAARKQLLLASATSRHAKACTVTLRFLVGCCKGLCLRWDVHKNGRGQSILHEHRFKRFSAQMTSLLAYRYASLLVFYNVFIPLLL